MKGIHDRDTANKKGIIKETNIIDFDKKKISHLENKTFTEKEKKVKKIQEAFKAALPVGKLSWKEKRAKKKRLLKNKKK